MKIREKREQRSDRDRLMQVLGAVLKVNERHELGVTDMRLVAEQIGRAHV